MGQILNSLVTSLETGDETKAEALVFQAKMAWKFYHDEKSALEKLSQAEDYKVKNFELLSMRSRIERETGAFTQAIDTAERAFNAALSEKQKIDGAILLGEALWAYAQRQIVNKESLPQQTLQSTVAIMNENLSQSPGYPEASSLLLGLALLERNGEMAFFPGNPFSKSATMTHRMGSFQDRTNN